MRRFLMVAMAAIAAATLAACSHSSLQQSLLPSQPGAAYSDATPSFGIMTQEELTVLAAPRYRACGEAPRGYETCYAILSSAHITPNLAPRASCLHLPGCYMPVDLQGAYGLTSAAKSKGKGITVAVVDAFGYTGGYKGAAKDLATFRKFAGLPACGKGCFTILNQNGGTKLPKPGTTPQTAGWQGEEALDIDMVSAICPNCKILMIQANSDLTTNLLKGEQTALNKANYVSNSWGSDEQAATYGLFDSHPGKIITASAGDSGAGIPPSQGGAPEAQPCGFTGVVCVGGTSLNAPNGVYKGETVWEDFHIKSGGKLYNLGATGSGCSILVAKPSWQKDKGCKMRSATDISTDADPVTGVVVACTPCDPSASEGLIGGVGGTSASAPMIAAMYALAGGASLGNNAAQKIWTSSGSNFHDVTSGFNDAAKIKPPLLNGVDKRTGLVCNTAIAYICKAGTGYDGPTGWGSPNGLGAF